MGTGNYDKYIQIEAERSVEGDGCSCSCSECDLPKDEQKDCQHYKPPQIDVEDDR